MQKHTKNQIHIALKTDIIILYDGTSRNHETSEKKRFLNKSNIC